MPLLRERRLIATCEMLRSALESSIGLTSLRVDLHLPDGKLRSFILTAEGLPAQIADPRRIRAQVPARLTIPLRDGRVFGSVTVEDERRHAYPGMALADLERTVALHAPALSTYVREGDID